jgi:hypothetical protein
MRALHIPSVAELYPIFNKIRSLQDDMNSRFSGVANPVPVVAGASSAVGRAMQCRLIDAGSFDPKASDEEMSAFTSPKQLEACVHKR